MVHCLWCLKNRGEIKASLISSKELSDSELEIIINNYNDFFAENFSQRLEWGQTTTEGIESFAKILLYVLEYKCRDLLLFELLLCIYH